MDKLRTLGRRIATRRAVVFLCVGAIVSAVSGMFCGTTQSGLLMFYDYEVAKWEEQSSKFDWPGPMPKAWNSSMSAAPDRVNYTRSIAVGWMHVRLDKVMSHRPVSNLFSYTVYAWGFPIPSMRHDAAFEHPLTSGWPSANNVVDSEALRGIDVTLGKFGANSLPIGVVPLFPWWPGFILNTLIWSVFLAWVAKTLQRACWFKRMERGQCVKCKYQIGMLRICPECATVKPVQ